MKAVLIRFVHTHYNGVATIGYYLSLQLTISCILMFLSTFAYSLSNYCLCIHTILLAVCACMAAPSVFHFSAFIATIAYLTKFLENKEFLIEQYIIETSSLAQKCQLHIVQSLPGNQ